MAELDYSNPFLGVSTPDARYYQREADIQKRYDPMGFWVGEAARVGSRLRRDLNRGGIALGRDDEIALDNQAAMESIQKDLAAEVEAGTMTPEAAQKEAIKRTMQAFMMNGDYESAASLKPYLDKIEEEELERGKLRSEIAENVQDVQTGIQQEDAYRALAEQRRTKAVEKAEKEEYDVTPSDKTKIQMTHISSARAIDRMGQMIEIVERNPAAMSSTAGALQTIREQFVGAKNTVKSILGMMNAEDRQVSESIAASYEDAVAANAEALRAKHPSLNIDVAAMRSLTMDLAYSLAKARDPGGRLSDADVKNAIEIIGVSGDPEAMKATLRRLVQNTYDDLLAQRKGMPYVGKSEEMAGARELVDSAYNRYIERIEALGKTPRVGSKPQPGGKAPASESLFDAEGNASIVLPNGKTVKARRYGD